MEHHRELLTCLLSLVMRHMGVSDNQGPQYRPQVVEGLVSHRSGVGA